jgi:cysteinyl-tRNA synthetase
LRDLLEVYPGEVLRLALLARHYRAPLNFSERGLDQARNSLNSLYRVLRDHTDTPSAATDVRDSAAFAALLDDLNTPATIAELHRFADALAAAASPTEAAQRKAELLAAGALLGLLQQDPVAWFQAGDADAPSTAWIEERIAARQAARKARDFALSDAIRDELAAAGILLEDTAEGTRWQRAAAVPTDEA